MIAVTDLHLRQGTFALSGVTFCVPAGAYAVLMGPTGSGKTTILECVAGLRRPSTGTITLAGRDVTTLPPAARNIGYVPQDGALFSHLTVRENIAFGLSLRGLPEDAVQRRVNALADRLGVRDLLNRQAVGLSGGEAQRVALGRAVAFRPSVLLLDEPLSGVDEETRDRLIELLEALRGDSPMTVLHVTHSRTEANRLADQSFRITDSRVEGS
jgi:molybdate/tungstate transport system ATP-binding protein